MNPPQRAVLNNPLISGLLAEPESENESGGEYDPQAASLLPQLWRPEQLVSLEELESRPLEDRQTQQVTTQAQASATVRAAIWTPPTE